MIALGRRKGIRMEVDMDDEEDEEEGSILNFDGMSLSDILSVVKEEAQDFLGEDVINAIVKAKKSIDLGKLSLKWLVYAEMTRRKGEEVTPFDTFVYMNYPHFRDIVKEIADNGGVM